PIFPSHSTPTPSTYTLSLHDALPIFENSGPAPSQGCIRPAGPASRKENTMAKYLLLKHYRGAPAPVNDVPMDQWKPDEVEAHCRDRKSTRLNSSHLVISYAVFCLKKK